MTTRSPDPRRPAGPADGRAPSGRRGLRALLPLGIAGWALLEIWLLTLLGEAAGGLAVFLVLAGGVLLGGVVIRRAGRRAWRRLVESAQRGESPRTGGQGPGGPGAPGGRGLMPVLGGLLLMVPGLASDVVGLLCLFPPTAALLSRAGVRYLTTAGGRLAATSRAARHAEEQFRIRRHDGPVVRGEVIRDDADTEGPADTERP